MDCIFCKIASGKAPSTILYETDALVVINDLNPQAPAHMLVIPKKHYATLLECDDKELLGSIFEAAKAAAKKAGVAESGFRTVINTNEEGGQTVAHLHMHLLGGRQLTGRMG